MWTDECYASIQNKQQQEKDTTEDKRNCITPVPFNAPIFTLPRQKARLVFHLSHV